MGLLLLLGAALSLDALGIGVSYGLRDIRIEWRAQAVIGALTFLYTMAAALLGRQLLSVIPQRAAGGIGIALLFAMGIFVMVSSLKKGKEQPKSAAGEERTIASMVIRSFGITIRIIKNPAACDLDRSNSISVPEAAYLVLVLCLDSMGAVIGTALTGAHATLLPVFTALFQILFLNAGLLAGKRLTQARWADSKCVMVLPGVILIAIGLLRIFA